MTRTLTPYDTGARLEPQLWPKGDADTFGLVDFDDDESHTVLTVHVERRGSGYALHVRNLTATLTMVGEAGGPSWSTPSSLTASPSFWPSHPGGVTTSSVKSSGARRRRKSGPRPMPAGRQQSEPRMCCMS